MPFSLSTFNGAKFVLLTMVRGSCVVGVSVPTWFPRDGRWPKRTYVDLLELWQNGDRTETISLDRTARLCGLPGKTGTGAEYAQKWATDRQAALDYLRADLELTAAVYRRLCPATGANDTNDDRL